MKVRSFLTLPFVVLFELLRMLFFPALVVAGAWLFTPATVFLVILAVAGVYTLIVLAVWQLRLRATLRRIGRAPIVITALGGDDDRGARRRGRR
ncbi:hypothetical protein [Kutzneria chonburiensis]|uniref:DUF4229 domain-containing protein n=1 Tax=Kutzneria chonburiensis TaxID=1483604 RepID=A0ABV6MK29_9PSEU